MAYLDKAGRDQLLDELKDKSFNRIKGILRRKDQKIRLAYYRNVQETDRWMTRYFLETLGVQVTLVESHDPTKGWTDMMLEEIIIEPTPDNPH